MRFINLVGSESVRQAMTSLKLLLNALIRWRFYLNIGNRVSAFRHVFVKLLSNFAEEKNTEEWDELNYPNVYPNPPGRISNRQFG